MRNNKPLLIGMSLCCLLGWTSCASSKFYDREVQVAYDEQGHPRKGYATLNIPYLDAIDADLKACYKERP